MFAPCPKRYCCIGTDNYNRADADDPGAAWDELQTGDADISGNTLLMAATPAETVIRFQTAHPGGANAAARVKVRFMLDSLADQCGVLMSGSGTSVDMSPFCMAIIRQTGSCNELLLQGANGLETSIQRLPGLTANEWHEIEVCFQPGDTSSSPEVAHILRAKVKLASGKVYGDQLEITSLSNHTLGAYVGLRGYAGTKFDDFYFGWASYDDQCHAQCPECNTPCPIEDDDFNRGASSDLGCKWIEISGGWEIAFNELACTSAGIVLCAVHHPQDKPHQRVTARLLADSTRTPRIRVNTTVDGSSGHWAQLSYNDVTNVLTLSIGKDGTTLDSVTSTLDPAAYVETQVCYDGGILVATANGSTVYASSTHVADGTYAGFEGIGGQERFDDFVFTKAESETDPPDPDCPDCSSDIDSGSTPCENCEAGNMSLEFLLTGDWFSSPEQEGSCGDLPSCNDLGALLLAAGFDPTTDCLGCAAGATLAMCPILGPGTGASVVVCITENRVEVLYWLEGNVGFADSFIKYRKDYDGPFNCLEFDDEPIPFHSLTDLNGFPGNTEACGPVPDFVFLTSL